jgi:hypothetical protein
MCKGMSPREPYNNYENNNNRVIDWFILRHGYLYNGYPFIYMLIHLIIYMFT